MDCSEKDCIDLYHGQLNQIDLSFLLGTLTKRTDAEQTRRMTTLEDKILPGHDGTCALLVTIPGSNPLWPSKISQFVSRHTHGGNISKKGKKRFVFQTRP